MTQKIEDLKEPITKLYSIEGRTKSYIANLFNINRKTLGIMINHIWKLEKAQKRHLTPSNEKFYKKHKALIETRLLNCVDLNDIAKELKTDAGFLRKTIIPYDKELQQAYKIYLEKRLKDRNHIASQRIQKQKDKSSYVYDFEDLPGEIWKEILGNPTYFVSNKGRIKNYIKRYNSYKLITPQANCKNGYLQIKLPNGRGYKVHRLVGFTFLSDSYSKINNTINHIDGDKTNNSVDNLEWVSQAVNNKKAFENGKKPSIEYSRLGRFKEIELDKNGKIYKFKNIDSFARFIGKSGTQATRYIIGELKYPHKITLIY